MTAYICTIFLLTGPLDYITTYYGVFMVKSVKEANPLVQTAISNGFLFEYLMFGGLLVAGLLEGTFRFAEAYDINQNFFELLTLLILGMSAFIVVNNIIQIFIV